MVQKIRKVQFREKTSSTWLFFCFRAQSSGLSGPQQAVFSTRGRYSELEVGPSGRPAHDGPGGPSPPDGLRDYTYWATIVHRRGSGCQGKGLRKRTCLRDVSVLKENRSPLVFQFSAPDAIFARMPCCWHPRYMGYQNHLGPDTTVVCSTWDLGDTEYGYVITERTEMTSLSLVRILGHGLPLPPISKNSRTVCNMFRKTGAPGRMSL